MKKAILLFCAVAAPWPACSDESVYRTRLSLRKQTSFWEAEGNRVRYKLNVAATEALFAEDNGLESVQFFLPEVDENVRKSTSSSPLKAFILKKNNNQAEKTLCVADLFPWLFSSSGPNNSDHNCESQNGSVRLNRHSLNSSVGSWVSQNFLTSKSGPKASAQVAAGKRNPYPLPKWASLSHIEGKGIGYSVGYTRLDIFLAPDYKKESFLPMIDLSGLRFNDNTFAANVGLIGRYFRESFCEILGGNIYYDFRQGVRGSYHQLGVGMEVIGKKWDFRANAYVPLGVKRHTTKCVFDDYIGPYCATKRENEFAAYTYNAMIGYQLINSDAFSLYLAAGPYYFSGEFDTTAMGGKVSVRPQYKDYLVVDLSFSHDNVFGSIFQVEVVFSLPLYHLKFVKNQKGPCGIPNSKIYQPVERFWVMPLSENCCWKSNF